MFHRFLNEIRIQIRIKPDGPILIKAGVDASGKAMMNFVRTMRGGRQEVYLPGSSLKGALRSHAERIARTLRNDSVCNPFNTYYQEGEGRFKSPWGVPNCHETVCSVDRQKQKQKQERLLPAEKYRVSCPACQLFGSLLSAGHFSVSDAYLVEPTKTADPEIRDGVAIDRFSGGASDGGKFQFEGLTDGEFAATLILQNVTWWQVSWIALVLRDMQDGLVTIGLGASRGLGRIQTTIEGMTLDLVGVEPDDFIRSIGDMYKGDYDYGFEPEDMLLVPDELEWKQCGIRQRLTIKGDQVMAFLEELHPMFADYIQADTPMHAWRVKHGKTEGLIEYDKEAS